MRTNVTFMVITIVAAFAAGCSSYEEVRLARMLADVQASMAPRAARYHSAPGGPQRIDTSGFDEAVAMASHLEFARAAGRFASLVDMFEASGEDRRAAEVVFWLAYCREKQGRTEEAGLLYQRVLRKYADAPASREAERRLGALSQP